MLFGYFSNQVVISAEFLTKAVFCSFLVLVFSNYYFLQVFH